MRTALLASVFLFAISIAGCPDGLGGESTGGRGRPGRTFIPAAGGAGGVDAKSGGAKSGGLVGQAERDGRRGATEAEENVRSGKAERDGRRGLEEAEENVRSGRAERDGRGCGPSPKVRS